ncbi:MAG: hypothetical protein AAFW69_12285 [Pseudomonadota bacterium]
MEDRTKIATCCYCGTRAALVLDRGRHELVCSACGAPLHSLKRMPVAAPPKRAELRPAKPAKPAKKPKRDSDKRRKSEKKKRWKSPLAKFADEAWDVVEDIFD